MAQYDSVDILLVEDNQSDAELTVSALRNVNLANNLVHLNNGEEALDFIFARGKYSGGEADLFRIPKVVLLDLKMPKINGIEVLKKIRGNEKTKKIPVIILTSSREDPDIKACYPLGVNSYIVKPVEFENFVKAVSDLGLYWLLMNDVPQNS